ncbi:hypothetical protein GW17_00051471 [Ensete ventricosum]|nr:hypothetical protein GW17_00051471 [Ensete ventricosum]
MVTARTGRYFHPVTTRNRSIMVNFDCRRSLSGSNDRFRPSVVNFGRYHPREKKKRENKENLESGTALRLRDPLPTGDFFSPHGEKKCLLTWGE